jgi:hypothetical protein
MPLRKTILAALVFSVLAGGALHASPAVATDRQVLIVLKFLPAAVRPDPAPLPVFQPASCPACSVVHDAAYERRNAEETLLALRLPAGRALDLVFTGTAAGIRRVVLEKADLVWRQDGPSLHVAVPPQQTGAVEAGEFHTVLTEPGLTTRIEHADPVRRAGDYAAGRFPLLEREAATNLEFSMREASHRLALGATIEAEHLGPIQFMGFDSNDPAGHRDAPPHVHMHMRWPGNIGTQIGHYYIDDRGLLAGNRVGIAGLARPQQHFAPGETFTTTAPDGRPVYSNTITREGGLRIARPDGAACLISPLGTGFDKGAGIDCGSLGATTLMATDDIVHGVLVVRSDATTEKLTYDPDTGWLLSVSREPTRH